MSPRVTLGLPAVISASWGYVHEVKYKIREVKSSAIAHKLNTSQKDSGKVVVQWKQQSDK